MRHISKGVALALAIGGGLLATGPAHAITGFSTAHLNLRTGPGIQYPVVGVMDRNVPSSITGCLADYSWCAVTVAGLNGWASAEYLVTDQDGRIRHILSHGPELGIPVVAAEGVVEVVAPAHVGVVVGADGHVEAIVPEPAVVAYIAATPVKTVHVQGEIVVGAIVPATVQLYAVPGSTYGHVVLNGVPVLVDANTRAVVYIHRA